jgi:hypothetical protein
VCHKCDNPKCVNPHHHFFGTRAENMYDRKSKDRYEPGEGNGRAKLTEENVVDIRRRHASGEKVASLAREFGVSWTAVKYAIKGRNWRYLS